MKIKKKHFKSLSIEEIKLLMQLKNRKNINYLAFN